MKLTRTFIPNHYSTTYIWSAVVEGEELRYQVEVEESSRYGPPISYLEKDARRQILRAIENKLFGENQ